MLWKIDCFPLKCKYSIISLGISKSNTHMRYRHILQQFSRFQAADFPMFPFPKPMIVASFPRYKKDRLKVTKFLKYYYKMIFMKCNLLMLHYNERAIN